jgi:CRISPR/Cas system type I-B associated protein Csh2 (Cas7 group RAMP superfamily)
MERSIEPGADEHKIKVRIFGFFFTRLLKAMDVSVRSPVAEKDYNDQQSSRTR